MENTPHQEAPVTSYVPADAAALTMSPERFNRWANSTPGDGGDENRDYAEEAYNAAMCPACGTSPCESEDGHEAERIAEMYAEAAGEF
jgi:hypothetical protein